VRSNVLPFLIVERFETDSFSSSLAGWSEGDGGLPYIALVVACFIGFGTSRWSDSIYDRKRDSNNGIPIPEYRLIGAMCFAWMLPAGLFIFSFTQYGFITPAAPIISLVLILVRRRPSSST